VEAKAMSESQGRLGGDTGPEIPFGLILGLLRGGSPVKIGEAIRGRDRSRLARLLRDRDVARIVAAARAGDMGSVVDAQIAVDEGKRRAVGGAQEAQIVAAAVRARLDEAGGGRDSRRLADAVRARQPRRLAAILRGRDAAAILRALRAGDESAAARTLLARPPGLPGTPLDEADVNRILEALPADEGRIARLADAVRAADFERRVLAKIARGLRGRDPDAVIAWLRSGSAAEVAASGLPGRVGLRPLTRAQARRIAAALPTDDDALADLARRILSHAEARAPVALDEAEVDAVLAALSALPLDDLARRLKDRGRVLWEEVFRKIYPPIVAAIRSRLFGTATRPLDPDAANSAANSVAETFFKRVEAGQFQDYQLESIEDLAVMLIRIGYAKAAARLQKRDLIHLDSLGGDDVPGASEPPAGGDELSSIIEGEVIGEFRRVLAGLEASLSPVDRLVLRCKLDEGLTFEQIARRVEAECGGRCSKEKARWRWDTKIVGPLKARTARLAD
jgi:hypothetical protein